MGEGVSETRADTAPEELGLKSKVGGGAAGPEGQVTRPRRHPEGSDEGGAAGRQALCTQLSRKNQDWSPSFPSCSFVRSQLSPSRARGLPGLGRQPQALRALNGSQ